MNRFKTIFSIILLISCSFALSAAKQDTITLRVMTYNLRFGELASLEQIAEHIKAFKPDFVALEELDCRTNRKRAPHQNGKDFISTLAYNSGMFGLYGKTIEYSGGYYGIGILSKYPYFEVNKMMMPNPEKKEPRALLSGKFEVNNDTIVFAATHLDVSTIQNREIQAKFITDYFKDSKYPVILGGDFNATPKESAIAKIMEKNWFNATNGDLTFPAWNPTIKIDYLFCQPRNQWHVIKTQTVNSLLSDHLPIVSDIQLIRNK